MTDQSRPFGGDDEPSPFADLQHAADDLNPSAVPEPPPAPEPFADDARAFDDDQVDLNARLRGYTPPVPGQEPRIEQRICPGCGGVRQFKDGKCQNCGYVLAAPGANQGAAHLPGDEDYSYTGLGADTRPLRYGLLIAGLLVVLGVVVWFFVVPLLSGDDAPANSNEPIDAQATSAREGDASFTGSLQAVTLDDAFKGRVAAAMAAGNAAWEEAGRDAYVYRVNFYDNTVPATSQQLVLTGYVGGADADAAVLSPSDEPFRNAMTALLNELNERPGVEASLNLEPVTGDYSLPSEEDEYVAYGYDYGMEHWDDIQRVVEAIENYKSNEGQYPRVLDDRMVPGLITKGGPNFSGGGFGYIPVFSTDGSGNIRMGNGAGIAKLTPAEVSGYYLIKFLNDPAKGVDFYSQADLDYYTKNISPFPYQPEGSVHNMAIKPDGKPDGVAAVVHNGELMRF